MTASRRTTAGLRLAAQVRTEIGEGTTAGLRLAAQVRAEIGEAKTAGLRLAAQVRAETGEAKTATFAAQLPFCSFGVHTCKISGQRNGQPLGTISPSMASSSNSTRSPDTDRPVDSLVPPMGSAINPYHTAPIVPNRRVPAWVLSLVLHTLILVVLLLMLAQFPRGGSEVENRTGGIVLVDLKSTTTEYLSEGDVEETSQEQQTAAASAAATPQLELAPELPGMDSKVNGTEGVAELIADGIDGVNDMTTSEPMGKIGGEVTTEVFGVTGTGSRFVYVFDRSESMDGYNSKPLLAARQQLIKSIESLKETNQFQIIFYNDQIKIFNPDGDPTMYFANEDIKLKAKKFINGTHPKGGTDHLYALKQAFKLKPDVIFLLTDAEGGFTNAEITEVVRNNRSAAVINTVEFGIQRGRDRSLESVSKTSGGQYVFKNIRTLRVDR